MLKISYQKLFWIITLFTTFIRLSVIGKIGITVDEAHYWVYSKFLDLSYYDHPPLIGYIIKLFTEVFGINEFAVRLPSVIIFVAASWIFFISAKKIFNEKIALISIVLLNILPVFSFLGAVVTIPDSPLSLFWLISFYLFINIVDTSKKRYWYFLGLSVGFALLSKYTAVMIYPSIILFLILSKQHRFWLKQKELYISMLIAFICFIPVILWNLENNWASFGFQLRHGFGSSLPKFSFTLFGRSLAAQAGYVSPFLFIFFCYGLYKCTKNSIIKKDKASMLIASFSLPVLLFFNLIATFNEILPHWPAMGYLILTMYVAYLICENWQKKRLRKAVYISCALAMLMNILLPLHCIYKIIPLKPFLPKAEANKIEFGIERAEVIDPTNDLFGWKELKQKIDEIYSAYPQDNKPFIFTHKSYLASQIFFYVPDLRVYCFSDKIDAYDLWQRDISNLKNKDAIFITSNFFDFQTPQDVYPFEIFEEPIELPIYRNNTLSKKFWLTICKNFEPEKLPQKYTADLVGERKTIKQGFIDTDHKLFLFINKEKKNVFTDKIVSKISYCDSKGFNMPLILMILFSIFVLRKEKKEQFWILVALVICVSVCAGIFNTVLKDIFTRARPLAVFGDGNISVFYEIVHRNSFPSGHSEAAFALAVSMLMLVPKYWYVFLLFALWTPFERIYAGCHFPSDVFAGALVGALSAYIMINIFRKSIKYKKFLKGDGK